mmetsp:Transcript_28493/g.25357  ORF Transcript_28493/g.25357 Transcript_28493/m.25357 type:complete len:222 (+) Transcript_28493:1621-2286(+)
MKKVSSSIKEDFSDKDLQVSSNFDSISQKRSEDRPSNCQVEREFYYESEWNSLKPNIIWAYILQEICKDGSINRETVEKLRGLPMPKFMPKGASILETILLISVIDLPYRSGNVKIESNQGLGMIITSPYQCLIYKDFFKKSEFNLTNTTIVRVNLESVARSQKKILQQGDPLWTDATYQCNIIITNLTAVEQDFQFMFQIPQGSISVRNNKTVNYSSITL